MKINSFLLVIISSLLLACGSNSESTKSEKDESTKNEKIQTAELTPISYIDTDSTYTLSDGKTVRIQNSFPKGGGYIEGEIGYTDSLGNRYGMAIFWNRFVNESSSPLELSISLPADSIQLSEDDEFFRLFIPPGQMNLDQQSSPSYGIFGLRYFLKYHSGKPGIVETTIEPNADYIFYVVIILRTEDNGSIRNGFYLKDDQLFYRSHVEPQGTNVIPSGQIAFIQD